MISIEKPVCGITTPCGGFKLGYYPMQGVGELQPVLFDYRGRQFYVTHASDNVLYREIPTGGIYMASGTEPITNLPSIIQAMPGRLMHFVNFIRNHPI